MNEENKIHLKRIVKSFRFEDKMCLEDKLNLLFEAVYELIPQEVKDEVDNEISENMAKASNILAGMRVTK